MNRSELQALIENGEDSGVEFKRDDIGNHDVAKELVAMLNLDGGTLLLGIEDDGSITGTVRPNLEEWITELCRVKIDPPVIPFLSWVRNAEPDRDVLAVRVTIGPDKPYAHLHNNRKTYFIRVGSTSQEASRTCTVSASSKSPPGRATGSWARRPTGPPSPTDPARTHGGDRRGAQASPRQPRCHTRGMLAHDRQRVGSQPVQGPVRPPGQGYPAGPIRVLEAPDRASARRIGAILLLWSCGQLEIQRWSDR